MRRAALLLLALLLLTGAWLLLPHFDPQRPAVSLGLLLTFCGGWTTAIVGATRALAPEVSP